MNITEAITRFNEMIAGIKIAVVFQCWTVAAGRSVNAQQMAAEVGLDSHLEQLNINSTHIVT
jgi:hypothetical protein